MTEISANDRIELSKASVLAIDASQHSLDVLNQILRGFGVGNVARSSSINDAEKLLRTKSFDLILIDPSIEESAGYGFVSELRHSTGKNCHIPVVLTTGYVRAADVAKGRDVGSNFVVAKPLSPTILLQRILWVARDKRPFVDVGGYIGPDRRFKFTGPPAGSDGRRDTDLTSPLEEASEPNLSQDEVSALIKPQKVLI